MTCREVAVEARRYRFCPEDPPPFAHHIQSIVRGRFFDELTGREISAAISVASESPEMSPRVSEGGIAGLVGNPGVSFPGLAVNSVDLHVAVSAHRFLTRSFRSTLGPIAGFPDTFQPVDLGDVPMHREPVVLRGRAVRNGPSPRVPVVGATIDFSGVWSTFPAAGVDPNLVKEVPDLVALRPGLYSHRSAGADVLRRRNMTIPAGLNKRLLVPAVLGDQAIRVSDVVGLAVGNLIAIDRTHTELAEFLEIVAIDSASTPDQPGSLTLRFPLACEHREDSIVERADPAAIPGADNDFVRDAIPGDRTAVLNGLVDLASGDVIEIAGATNEYHTAELYETSSDADGYFRLALLHRVALVDLRAQIAGPSPNDLRMSPDYDAPEQRIDVVFP